jgi:hypothetical protein
MSEEIESIVETAFLIKEINSLTKREQFAMAAMAGLCSCPIPGTHNQAANVSKEAVKQADALLAELAKEKACDTK